MAEKTRIHATFSMTPQTHALLRKLAQARGTRMSYLLEELIRREAERLVREKRDG